TARGLRSAFTAAAPSRSPAARSSRARASRRVTNEGSGPPYSSATRASRSGGALVGVARRRAIGTSLPGLAPPGAGRAAHRRSAAGPVAGPGRRSGTGVAGRARRRRRGAGSAPADQQQAADEEAQPERDGGVDGEGRAALGLGGPGQGRQGGRRQLDRPGRG